MARVNSGYQWYAGGNDFLGKLVTLITESGCRYEGVVNFMNLERSVIGLRNVIFFGTEERVRWDGLQVPPAITVYQAVLFQGNLIRYFEVIDIPSSPPFVLDPVPVPPMEINIGPPLPPPGLVQPPMHIPCPPPFGRFPPPVHIRPPFGQSPPSINIPPPPPSFMFPIANPPVHNIDLSIMQLEHYAQPICMSRPFNVGVSASTSQRRFNQPGNRNMGEPSTQPSNLVVPGQGRDRGQGWGRGRGRSRGRGQGQGRGQGRGRGHIQGQDQVQIQDQVQDQVRDRDQDQDQDQDQVQVEDQVEDQGKVQVEGLNLDLGESLGLVQDQSLDLDLSRDLGLDLSQGQSLSPRVGMIVGGRIWTGYPSRETSKFPKIFGWQNDPDDEKNDTGSSDD